MISATAAWRAGRECVTISATKDAEPVTDAQNRTSLRAVSSSCTRSMSTAEQLTRVSALMPKPAATASVAPITRTRPDSMRRVMRRWAVLAEVPQRSARSCQGSRPLPDRAARSARSAGAMTSDVGDWVLMARGYVPKSALSREPCPTMCRNL